MVVAAAVIAAGAGVAYATAVIGKGNGPSVIVGCAKNENGQLRIVNDSSDCLASEHPVQFQAPISEGPQNVFVDCAVGQSINAALAQAANNPSPLNININGTCTEAVTISRDNVGLFAAAPGSGIAAPSASDTPLSLNGAEHVRISGLTLTGGRNGLQAFAGASFDASNLHVTGANEGVVVNGGAFGNLNQSTIGNSAQDGIGVWSGGTLNVNGGTISDSGNDGVNIQEGHVDLSGVLVTNSGFMGLDARDGGSAEIQQGSTVQYSRATGVNAFNGGSINVGSGSLVQYNNNGGVGTHGGSANLQGAHVANNFQSGVFGFAGGRLTIQGATIIEDNQGSGVGLTAGSAVSIEGAVIIRGNTGNGIDLQDTGVAIFGNGQNQIVNNGGWGVFCQPSPAVAMIAHAAGIGTVTGNAAGQISCPTT